MNNYQLMAFFKKLPKNVEQYIYYFLDIDSYNRTIWLRNEVNYKIYFKQCSNELPQLYTNYYRGNKTMNSKLIDYLYTGIKYNSLFERNEKLQWVCNYACLNGNLPLIQYMHTKYHADFYDLGMCWATKNRLEIVKYLYEVVGMKYVDSAIHEARMYWRNEVLEYLIQCKKEQGYKYLRHSHTFVKI